MSNRVFVDLDAADLASDIDNRGMCGMTPGDVGGSQ